MSTSIPISGLNRLSNVTGSDYVPLVQSSSVTTFRTHLSSIMDLMTASGSASSSLSSLSASYAKSASVAGTASFAQSATTASNATTASFALNTPTSSFAFSANTSSFSLVSQTTIGTASFATNTISASFAARTYTSSFLQYNNGNNGTASYAINAGSVATASFATSASFAQNALTASFSITSSFVNTASFAVTTGTNAFGLKIISRVNYAASTSNAWSRIDVTSQVGGISSTATFAYVWIMAWNKYNQGYVYVSADHNTLPQIIATVYSTRLDSENGIPWSTVMFVPLSTGLLYAGSKTFDVYLGNPDSGYAVTLQDYI